VAHPCFELKDVDGEFWAKRLDPFLPQKIFDAHRHIMKPEHRAPDPSERQKSFWTFEVSHPETLEEAELGCSLLFPGRSVSYLAFGSPSLKGDLVGNNRYLADGLKGTESAALALAPPVWDAEKLLDQLRQPRIIGIKPYQNMIPGFEGEDVSIFDFCPHEHLEVLDGFGAWLTLHVPRKERLADPDNIAEVLEIRRRYPDIILVIAHLGRSYAGGYARKGFPALAEDEGILFDTSAVLNPAVFALALDRIGPQRLLFGSDFPILYMRGRRRWEGDRYINITSGDYSWNVDRELPEVEATYTLYVYEAMAACIDMCWGLGFSDTDVRAIFYDNARRIVDRLLVEKENW